MPVTKEGKIVYWPLLCCSLQKIIFLLIPKAYGKAYGHVWRTMLSIEKEKERKSNSVQKKFNVMIWAVSFAQVWLHP